MSVSEAPHRRTRHRRWSAAEKRHIVELTLREGASISEIARTHGIHPTSLSNWRRFLYRTGKLTGCAPQKQAYDSAASAMLLPVTMIPEREPPARLPRTTVFPTVSTPIRESNTVHLSLPSGATVRFEIGALDVSFVRALLAELRT